MAWPLHLGPHLVQNPVDYLPVIPSPATTPQAPTERRDGDWTAVLDHTGATGEQVTLKAAFTDANGNGVTQIITRAYDIR
ncbi:hypothetical protein ACIQWZ_06005 [Streptomyces sp. NPDC098077]|uniref:hypothetical protein n=1 Tax=Streptomyces sp. NPDC098077 TaxID=3366093 RepID=UPI003825F02B